MEVSPLRDPHLHPLDQRIQNYALFPEVSPQKPVAQRCRHAAPADRAGLDPVGFAMRAERKVTTRSSTG
jgi:hypothetical protein